MIGNWEIRDLSEPKRYFAYAEAYLQASIDMCLRMTEHPAQQTWPNASVALMLAAHSVELFLKGAIVGTGHNSAWGHTIADLEDTYRAAYPDARFAFDCPFKTEYLGLTEAEADTFKKNKPQPSIQFRYPVRKPGVEWDGVHALDPSEFLAVLDELNESYSRLIGEFGDI